MNIDRNVTATFSFVKPVMIAGATPRYFNTLREAYDGAASTGMVIIKARTFTFTGDMNLDLVKNITLQGGHTASYTSPTGHTLLQGKLTVGKGSLVTDRLTVK